MTNEQLAELAQDPDNSELVPVLWDKVKDLLYMKAQRVYTARTAAFQRHGVELADIRQGCYMAFLDALKGYKPESGAKFSAYLNYPFKTMLADLTHTRTSKQEPLNSAVSIDKPIFDKGEAATLGDVLPCDTDIETDVLDQLEQDEERRAVRDAVARLPEREREAVTLFYFEGLTLQEIAHRWGCSYQNVAGFKAAGLRNLRRSPLLQQLYREYKAHSRWKQVQRLENRPECFQLVQEMRERQAQGEYISYGKYQATLYGVYLDAVRIADARLVAE